MQNLQFFIIEVVIYRFYYVLLAIFRCDFFIFDSFFQEPIVGFWPTFPFLWIDIGGDEYATCFLCLSPFHLTIQHRRDFIFMHLETLKQFLIIININICTNTLLLSVDSQGNMIGRTTDAQIIPMLRYCFAGMEIASKVIVIAHRLIKTCPELKFKKVCIRKSFYRLHRFRPVIRSFHNIEAWGLCRVTNLPQFYFQQKESDIVIGMLVQPFYSLAMFVTCSLHHPDNHFSTFT